MDEKMKNISTRKKALEINLNPHLYGTFAEIGAGQEVARWFFKAGGASGTIAKSISAYDMIFSDSIYGQEESGRYVCESRVNKMINYEYDLLESRLRSHRGDDCEFFSFANTVAARNYHLTNESHGWIGLKYKRKGDEECSSIVLHVRMLDVHNQDQQDTLGLIGVNLVYHCFHLPSRLEECVDSLLENIASKRIEINYVKTTGDQFSNWDDRLINLQLVKQGLTPAILFDRHGEILLCSERLYKKNIMVVRGSYRPPTLVNLEMINKGLSSFAKDHQLKESNIECMAEITTGNLTTDGDLSNEDFLTRVQLINALGQNVLITNFKKYYNLTRFLSGFKAKNMAIVLGAYNFSQIFKDEYVENEGGILEAFGHLFRKNVNVYLMPYFSDDGSVMYQSSNIECPKGFLPLLDYIRSLGQVKDIEGVDTSILHIYSRKVLEMIISGKKGWEELVPDSVAETINEECLFGHPCELN